jgi:hypothetical protein
VLDGNGNLFTATAIGSGAILTNAATITQSVSVPDNSNAISIGPIQLATGTLLTVPSGSTWRII